MGDLWTLDPVGRRASMADRAYPVLLLEGAGDRRRQRQVRDPPSAPVVRIDDESGGWSERSGWRRWRRSVDGLVGLVPDFPSFIFAHSLIVVGIFPAVVLCRFTVVLLRWRARLPAAKKNS